MDAWSQILSGAKTHGLVLVAEGAVISMVQSGEITMSMAIFLGAVAGSVSTMRFAIKKNGGKK